MVSKMAFMTMRSTLGMAKHIVKVSKHMRKTMINVMASDKAFRLAIQKGDVKGVNESWKTLFDALTEEENEIKDITRSEEIELRNEEKQGAKMKEFLDKLSAEDKQALSNLAQELGKEMQLMKEKTQEIMRELRYVYKDKEGIMRFKTRKTDPKLAKIIIRLAKREKKLIKLEESEQSQLEKLFHSEEKKKLSQKDFVKKVSALGAKEIANLKKELAEVRVLMHDINILHMHLIKKVYEVSQRDLAELQKEGFPSVQLQVNAKLRENLVAVMKNNMMQMFKMGKYLAKETKRAA